MITRQGATQTPKYKILWKHRGKRMERIFYTETAQQAREEAAGLLIDSLNTDIMLLACSWHAIGYWNHEDSA